MDVFTKEKRSEIMSHIRSKDTSPERLVFSHLRRNRIYFQKHYRRVAGNPDVAIPSRKLAVFIDGDFWHGRKFSKTKNRLPKKYWRRKIESNMMRDRKNRAILKRQGWRVLRIWESEIIKKPRLGAEKIISFILAQNLPQ